MLSQAVRYQQTPMGDKAHASLERDIHNFEKTVDAVAAMGRKPFAPVKLLSQTPLVLALVGADTMTGKAAASGGIYAAPHVFDKTHPAMTSAMLKQIPSAMADPIAIFDSETHAGDLVFMLELTDANGATVVTPIILNVSLDFKKVHVNIVKSAYSKEHNSIPSNSWFLTQFTKNTRYINRQKVKSWLSSSGANSPLGPSRKGISTNSLDNTIYSEDDLSNTQSTPKFENQTKKARCLNGQKMKRWQYAARVCFPIGTISNASGKKIYTEEDLVNARLQHQSLYRSVPAFALQRKHPLPDARSAESIEDRSVKAMQAGQVQDRHAVIQPGTQSGKTAPASNAAAGDCSGEAPQESMDFDAPWTMMTMGPGC